MSEALRLGISSCLLGNEVRYDGGHKRDRFLTDELGRFVEWVPVCPEVEAGLGTPRETLRLVSDGTDTRLLTKSGSDTTEVLERFSKRRVAALRKLDLSGYILKRDSPSCGMERVRVYSEHGMPRRNGRGLFAEALIEALPLLPIEEEGRLNDAVLRENFIERIFAYRRMRDLFEGRWRMGDLVAFQTAHKIQIMSHSPKAYRELGRLVGQGKGTPRAELRDRYQEEFMAALAHRATPRRHVNAMHHMLGFFRKDLDAPSRHELLGLIEDYRNGIVPLIVPLTLIGHHVRRLDVEYLRGQRYLEPHPRELMLRNRV
jgi:uncharacterized protein YbgA (DUF1722 family)/uncharacterized protein YbbK (DUF523 family)